MSEQGLAAGRAPGLGVVDVVRGVTAAATAAAAVVHFAYAPAHFDHTTSHGTFFAVIGWAQLLLAGALAFRAPRERLWLTATVALNAFVIGVWIVSRTVGVPGEDEAEPVGFPDTLTTVLEGVAVLGALAILLHLLADRPVKARPTFGFAAVAALATMVLVSLSIAPSFAGSHTHGEGAHDHGDGAHDMAGGDHDHGTGEGELAGGEHGHDDGSGSSDDHGHDSESDSGSGSDDDHGHDSASSSSDDDHAHSTGSNSSHDSDHDDDDGHGHGTTTTTHGDHGHATTTTTHGGHGHETTTTTTGHQHGSTTTTTHGHEDPGDDWAATRLAALTGHLTPEKIAEFRAKALTHLKGEIRRRSSTLPELPEAERNQRIDTFAAWSVDNALEAENGHSHGPKPWVPLTDPDDQRALQLQLTAAGTAIPRYPTAADAMAAGYTQVTPYIPGIAAHYMNFDLQDRTFDPAAPEMLLYNGNSPSSELVGVSYAMFGAQPGPNDGFVGANDEWHEHPSLCVLGVLVVGPDHTPDDLCETVGAFKLRGNSLWMSHLWQVPGWESQWGLFSGENPAINMATSDLMQP
ncbi:MAG TPA: hypothetical protein VK611_15940 [Acidimicrobiales bacterium]|nr:hypothetical protein [Acidimicrobiales bacterium]